MDGLLFAGVVLPIYAGWNWFSGLINPVPTCLLAFAGVACFVLWTVMWGLAF